MLGWPPGRRRPGQLTVAGFPGRLLPPIGIVVAMHIVWVGADEPGGAFQGGTILAALWVLAIMAGLIDAPAIGRPGCGWRSPAGHPIHGGGLPGLLPGRWLPRLSAGFAKPLILLIEAALVLAIAAMLALLVLGPPERAPDHERGHAVWPLRRGPDRHGLLWHGRPPAAFAEDPGL